MSLPPGLTTATITGTYIDATGSAQAGSVSFTPTTTVYDAAGKAVLTETPVTAPLSAGAFTLGPIPCTDNASLAPLGWAYTVSINVAGAQTVFTAYLPHALGATVDITQLPENPVVLSPSGVSYLPNASTVPTTNPSLGGGFLYAEGGALFWLGTGGTATQIGPAQGGLSNPMTTTGDMITASGGGAPARLAGNASSAKEFLTSTGSGGSAASPVWGAVAAGDLPAATGTTQGAVQLAGDLGGTAASPQVTGTHLASALPIAQGGTGAGTQQGAITSLTGTQAAGRYLRSDGASAALAAIQAADVPTLNQNTAGTAAGLSATLAIGSGGTGQVTQQAAINALTGAQSAGKVLRSDGVNAALASIQAGDLPAATSGAQGAVQLAGDFGGTATSPQVTGTHLASALPIAQGGTGQATQQAALDALAGAVTTGQYLRGNGTHVALSAIALGDIPSGVALLAGATFTGWIAPAVVTLTFTGSGTTTIDASKGNSFILTLTASTTTLGTPSNPVDGQTIRVRVIQGGSGSFTLAYGAAYDFGTAGAPTLSTAVGKVDILGFEYVGSLAKWCFLGSGLGF